MRREAARRCASSARLLCRWYGRRFAMMRFISTFLKCFTYELTPISIFMAAIRVDTIMRCRAPRHVTRLPIAPPCRRQRQYVQLDAARSYARVSCAPLTLMPAMLTLLDVSRSPRCFCALMLYIRHHMPRRHVRFIDAAFDTLCRYAAIRLMLLRRRRAIFLYYARLRARRCYAVYATSATRAAEYAMRATLLPCLRLRLIHARCGARSLRNSARLSAARAVTMRRCWRAGVLLGGACA